MSEFDELFRVDPYRKKERSRNRRMAKDMALALCEILDRGGGHERDAKIFNFLAVTAEMKELCSTVIDACTAPESDKNALPPEKIDEAAELFKGVSDTLKDFISGFNQEKEA